MEHYEEGDVESNGDGVKDLMLDTIRYQEQTLSKRIFHFYLFGTIEHDMNKYFPLIHTLNTATENDEINIYINSPGGSLYMALQICNTMHKTRANVITHLDAEAHSAASMIFLSGREYVINPNGLMLIHTYTGGMYGKAHELNDQMTFNYRTHMKMLEDYYGKILTEEELEKVKAGGDFWIDSDELIERISKSRGVEAIDFNGQDGDAGETVKPKKKSTKKKVSKKKKTKKKK